jgi:hypothetical protein
MKAKPTSSRVRGQALLMAVLLMVFAALLGATFVTVVSLNLSQTARTVSRGEAVTAAQAGLKFANDQITTESLDGEAWRPEKIAPPPDDNDSSYNFYYTPFERAQGWALDGNFSYADYIPNYASDPTVRTPENKWNALKTWKAQNANNRVFVKFPDPRGEVSGPSSLIEVSTEAAGDKSGMLRLTVIGRGEDNDTSFARLVAYKPTVSNGSPLSYARFDANFDVAENKPLAVRGTLGSDLKTATINRAAAFAPGVTVAMIQANKIDFGIVAQVSATQIALKDALPATFTAGAIEVRAASVLVDGLTQGTFDADGNGLFSAGYEATLAPRRDTTGTNGLFFNNAVYLARKVGLTFDVGKLNVGGSIASDGDNTNQTINGAALNSAAATQYITSGAPTLAPPALDSRFERYRRMTAETAPTSGGRFGYGEGVYLDNDDDIEKIGTRALKDWELQRLWQRKAIGTETLFYPAANAAANGFPKASGSLEERGGRGWINPWQFLPRGTFIELQGNEISITRDERSDDNATPKFWNSPNGAPLYGVYRQVIRIFANYHERYFDVNGTLTPVLNPALATPANVWPTFNGVIFAEGNVRVRGYLGGQNITIASLGTIYVEGNILRDVNNPNNPAATAPRIALIAKRNVVVNPTMFVGMPRAWHAYDTQRVLNTVALAESTTTTSQVVGSTAAGTQVLANLIRVGDVIRVAGQTTTVTAVSPDQNSGLTVSPAIPTPVAPATGSAIPVGSTITLVTADPAVVHGKTQFASLTESQPSGTYKYETDEYFYQLESPSGSFAREVRFDRPEDSSIAAPFWLNYFHGAQMQRAFTLKREGLTTRTVTIKKAAASPVITDAEKLFQLEGTTPVTIDLRDVNASAGSEGDSAETIQQLTRNNGHFPIKDASNANLWTVGEETANSKLVAARRLAQTEKTMIIGSYMPVTVTTSRQLQWSNGTTSVATWFGGAPASTPTATENDTIGEGVKEEFYWRDPSGALTAGREQALLRTTARSLTDGTNVVPNGWRNTFTLQMDDAKNLPGYRVAAARVSPSNFAVAGYFTPITISVQASIMAREGSFFVLPAPAMARTTTNASDPTKSIDLNGDNVKDGKDIAAATVYRRLNYQLEIRGNVMQNFAPSALADYDATADPDGQSVGPVARWLDTASFPAHTAGGPNSLAAHADFNGGIGAVSWNTVSYIADPVVSGVLPLPVSPELLYVG